MALAYDQSFGGVSFRILIEGAGGVQDALWSERPIPGGDVTYIDTGTLLPGVRSYRLLLPNYAAFASLALLVRTAGTLVDPFAGNATCRLRPGLTIEQALPKGEVLARAEFLVVG